MGSGVVAILIVAAVLGTGTAANAEESLRILEYDADGRVIGLRRVGPGGSKSPPDAQSDPTGRSSWQDDGASRPPVDDRFQRIIDGEILVANPPGGFETEARSLGFLVIERIRLSNLEMDALRLKIPRSLTVSQALAIIERRFPDATAEVNAVFGPSVGSAPASLARDAVSWPQVGDACGRDVRIGIIDGVVETSHAALAGQRLTYRSFHRKGWRPTAAEHGTAIAAMMIGKPADRGFGGVLPGAQVFAGNIFGKNREGLVGGDAVAMPWRSCERSSG